MQAELQKRILAILEGSPVLKPPGVSPEIFYKFCDIFLDSVPKTIQSLRDHRAGNSEIRKIAHRVKGACGFAGAIRLSKVAAELEQRAASVSDDELEYFQHILERVLEETRSAMNRRPDAER